MGWKTIKGRRYYYRSERVGERVVTRYVGKSEVASIFAATDELLASERAMEREKDRLQRDEDDRMERSLDDLVVGVTREAESHLQTLGYHRPKRGDWRRRRCRK